MSQIDDIKSRLDVAEVVGEYIQLRPAGPMSFKALCPFHSEKTPSFFVSKDKQIWHCFGCSLGGDIFEFIKRIDGVEFPEALRILAKKAGVVLKREESVTSNKKTKLLAALETAARLYEKNLWETRGGEPVLAYLRGKRGLSDETIKVFRMGFALESWDNLSLHLRKVGFSSQEIQDAGLGLHGKLGVYDRFRKRLMLPIANHHGQVVGFTGRIGDFLPSSGPKDDQGGKYVNTPETEAYHKREILYGLDKAKMSLRQLGFGMIVEGNMDVVGLHQAGFTNAVCSGGTALTTDQFSLMKRYAPKWMFVFDPDAAGEEATKRAFRDALQTDLEVYALVLPKGKDPDEVVKDSPELFREASKNALPMMQYFFHIATEKFSPKTLEGKKSITKMILPVIKDLSNPVERSHFLDELSRLVAVEVSALVEAMNKIKPAPTHTVRTDSGKTEAHPARTSSREEKISKEILSLILGRPEFMQPIVDRLSPEEFPEDRFVRLYKEAVSYYNTKVHSETESAKESVPFEKILSKNHSDLAPLAAELSLLFEKEFATRDDAFIQKRIAEYLPILMRLSVRKKLQIARRQLSSAEKEHNQDAIKALEQSVQFLMQSLKDLEKA